MVKKKRWLALLLAVMLMVFDSGTVFATEIGSETEKENVEENVEEKVEDAVSLSDDVDGESTRSTKVAIQELQIEETGYCRAKVSWTLYNPDNEIFESMGVQYSSDEGTISDSVYGSSIEYNSGTGRYSASFLTNGFSGTAKVFYWVKVAGTNRNEVVEKIITVSQGPTISDADVQIDVSVGYEKCNAMMKLKQKYSVDSGYLKYYMYYREREESNWKQRESYGNDSIEVQLNSNTEYEYYLQFATYRGVLYSYGTQEEPESFQTKELVTYDDNAFPDPVFRALVRKAANVKEDQQLTGVELEKISTLRSDRRYVNEIINSIEGVQYLNNLTELDIQGHELTDVSMISGLTHLKSLNLNNNNIIELPDLSQMQNLTTVKFDYNKISESSLLARKLPESFLSNNSGWIQNTSERQRGEVAVKFAQQYYAVNLGESDGGLLRPFALEVKGLKNDRSYTLAVTINNKTYTVETAGMFFINNIDSISEEGVYKANICLRDKYGTIWYECDQVDVSFVGDTHGGRITEINADTTSFEAAIILRGEVPQSDIKKIFLQDKEGNCVGESSYYISGSISHMSDLRYEYDFDYDISYGKTFETTLLTPRISVTAPLRDSSYDVVVALNDGTKYIVPNLVKVNTETVQESELYLTVNGERWIEGTPIKSINTVKFHIKVADGSTGRPSLLFRSNGGGQRSFTLYTKENGEYVEEVQFEPGEWYLDISQSTIPGGITSGMSLSFKVTEATIEGETDTDIAKITLDKTVVERPSKGEAGIIVNCTLILSNDLTFEEDGWLKATFAKENSKRTTGVTFGKDKKTIVIGITVDSNTEPGVYTLEKVFYQKKNSNETKDLSIPAGLVLTYEVKEIPHVHTLIHHEAKAATCTENGNNAYYTCTICNKAYKDETGKEATTVAEETIAALGHDMSLEAVQEATCKENGSKTRVCTRCKVEEVVTLEAHGHLLQNGKCILCDYKETVSESDKKVTVTINENTNAAVKTASKTIFADVKTGNVSAKLGNKVSAETAESIEAALTAGNSISVMMVADTISVNEIDSADLDELSKKSNENKVTIAQYLDLSQKILATDTTTNTTVALGNLEDTGDKIPVTITVPTELRKEGRKFSVIRLHNGLPEVIADDVVLDSNGQMVIESSLFSIYALAYKDPVIVANPGGGSNNNQPTLVEVVTPLTVPASTTTAVASGVPATGDASELALWVALSFVAVAGLTVATLFKRKK